MLTRILAQELSEYKISVNELIPGPVNTDMGNDSKKDNRSAFSISDEWIKDPEDVADYEDGRLWRCRFCCVHMFRNISNRIYV